MLEHGKVNMVNQFRNQWVSESLKYDLANDNLKFQEKTPYYAKREIKRFEIVSSKGIIDKSIPTGRRRNFAKRNAYGAGKSKSFETKIPFGLT